MVSQLYTAKKFYELQKKGKIAKTLSNSKKLHKKSNGDYFLYKKMRVDGATITYKQEVKPNSRVYSRQEGVTKYSLAKDKKRESTFKTGTIKSHRKTEQFNDLKTFENKYYKY